MRQHQTRQTPPTAQYRAIVCTHSFRCGPCSPSEAARPISGCGQSSGSCLFACLSRVSSVVALLLPARPSRSRGRHVDGGNLLSQHFWVMRLSLVYIIVKCLLRLIDGPGSGSPPNMWFWIMIGTSTVLSMPICQLWLWCLHDYIHLLEEAVAKPKVGLQAFSRVCSHPCLRKRIARYSI